MSGGQKKVLRCAQSVKALAVKQATFHVMKYILKMNIFIYIGLQVFMVPYKFR
jgi:hypothetical protein